MNPVYIYVYDYFGFDGLVFKMVFSPKFLPEVRLKFDRFVRAYEKVRDYSYFEVDEYDTSLSLHNLWIFVIDYYRRMFLSDKSIDTYRPESNEKVFNFPDSYDKVLDKMILSDEKRQQSWVQRAEFLVGGRPPMYGCPRPFGLHLFYRTTHDLRSRKRLPCPCLLAAPFRELLGNDVSQVIRRFLPRCGCCLCLRKECTLFCIAMRSEPHLDPSYTPHPRALCLPEFMIRRIAMAASDHIDETGCVRTGLDARTNLNQLLTKGRHKVTRKSARANAWTPLDMPYT